MSQSRNRRPTSRAREPPRTAAAPRADYVTGDAKENYGNKSTYKIPKSVRYDLENALVGLCDIWFEEIKPYLVKNKLKLHTGGALNEDLEPARDRSGPEEPRRAPGRLLDPGAAPDAQRAAASCRGSSPMRPAASRAPCTRPPLPPKPTPLSPKNFRKLLQLPDGERTRQPTSSTPAPQRLTQTYQRNVHSEKQWMRPPVHETPPRRSPPPLTRTQQKVQHTLQQKAGDVRKRLPGRKPTYWSTSPNPASPNLIHQQNVPNVIQQSTSSNRKTRKSKRVRRIPKFPPSLSQQPHRQFSRPCCIACALAANAQTADIPQRPFPATRLSLPRTKNTLPSKPLAEDTYANSKLRWLDVKIPRVSYPTPQPLANAMPPLVTRISTTGDFPPSPQIVAGKCYFVHGASGIRNSTARNKTQNHSASIAPFPPFERDLPLPHATDISPAGDVLSLLHVEVNNSSSQHVADGNYLPLHDFTCTRNRLRKTTQNHSAPDPPKFKRNWPSPLCATNIRPAVGNPPSLHIAAGDSPYPSNVAGSQNPFNAARTPPIPPHFKRNSPCPLRNVLPPTHAKCMSPVHARSQSPVSSHVAVRSLAPSEDESWFHRVFMDQNPQRRRKPRIKENAVPVNDICSTSSSNTIPFHQENVLQMEYDRPLFSKDLIDLIGNKNDERLRVLYENPSRGESHPSVMRLVGSQNKRRKTAPKKMPWR